MDNGLAAFVAVAAGMIMLPGADFAVVVRGALRSRTDGVATGLGVAGGLLLHTSLAVAGLAAVLVAEPRLFRALQLLGGGYLLVLGARSLRVALRAVRPQDAGEAAPPGETATGEGRRRALRHGFLTNALNPKAPVLFLSLLPQFVPAGHAALPRTLLLGAIIVVMGVCWFPVVALCAHRLGARLRGPRAQRAVEGVCGAMLLGLGAALLLEPLLG
jgi:threonine/homoserine/homoserine lactone efflux protein